MSKAGVKPVIVIVRPQVAIAVQPSRRSGWTVEDENTIGRGGIAGAMKLRARTSSRLAAAGSTGARPCSRPAQGMWKHRPVRIGGLADHADGAHDIVVLWAGHLPHRRGEAVVVVSCQGRICTK